MANKTNGHYIFYARLVLLLISLGGQIQENGVHVILKTQVMTLFGPTQIQMRDAFFVLLPRS